MNRAQDVVVVGGGIFGLTTALAIQRRGLDVALFDAGLIANPLAASTDISKVVRMEYGTDEEYMALVDRAIDGWHRWNLEFDQPLYHQTGVTMLTRQPMAPGGFEFESFTRLGARGHAPERLDAAAISSRFPAWRPGQFVDGFFNPRGGFVESGRVVEQLADQLRRLGAPVFEQTGIRSILTDGGKVTGVRTDRHDQFSCGQVIIAAGAWTPHLVPELGAMMKATGHPVFHLRPPRPEIFTSPDFAVFTADITNSGWYGFPLHPHRQVVKIANHGPGTDCHPAEDERKIGPRDFEQLRSFLSATFPELVDAPIVSTRLCLYCDTRDEHLWIDRHPEIDGLTVAAGGSGHAFKIAPELGRLVADAALGNHNEWLAKFAWREFSDETTGEEAARCHPSRSTQSDLVSPE